MLRMNQRNTNTEKVSIDTLLPSSNFILRGQITSPTMARGSSPHNFDDGELEVCVHVFRVFLFILHVTMTTILLSRNKVFIFRCFYIFARLHQWYLKILTLFLYFDRDGRTSKMRQEKLKHFGNWDTGDIEN